MNPIEQEPTSKKRNVHPVSRVDIFFDKLQYLIHLAVGDILFHDVQFTVLLTALNRHEYRAIDREALHEVPLVYTGLKAQKDLLKKSFSGLKETLPPWLTLEKTKQEEESLMEMLKVGRAYYGKIANGELALEDIRVGTLKEYFSGELNVIQKAEKAILEHFYTNETTKEEQPCFNTQEDLYLSVPLIGFAEFDGIAHIIFEKKGEDIVTSYLTGLVIKRLTIEYEKLFLDWAYIGENAEKRRSIENLFSNEIWDDNYWATINNPLLVSLGYQKRYQKYREYYDFRLDEADTIPDVLYLQYLRQAITATLIDSYAHNISAHSLTALSWWFRLRSSYRDKVKRDERKKLDELWASVDTIIQHQERLNPLAIKNLKADLDDIRNCRKNVEIEHAAQVSADGKSLITHTGHLSRELYPFFKFLMEKGAYWSGITRDANVGGKINSFFSVIWYDFINNPLFLGTIAKTEDIRSIKINITVYQPDTNAYTSNLIETLTVEQEGVLATIDLDKPRNETSEKDINNQPLYQRSIFVEPGEAYEALKDKLDGIKVYFPGGVVGKHAFFTMLENEIRNVKHYHGEELVALQRDGLTMNISIQPCSLPDSNRRELYRIGVWLKTPTVLQKDNDRHLVVKKWDALYDEITEKVTHSPKLGGTFQDKICAAMLLNSRFSSVQNGYKSENRDDSKDTNRDNIFFPWITPACSPITETNAVHIDFRLTANNRASFEQDNKKIPDGFSGQGYLKKYLHLWRFEDTLNLADGAMSPDENYSRFRFAFAPRDKVLSLRKDNGVVRVITTPQSSEKVDFIYRQWLETWNEGGHNVLLLEEGGKPHTLFALEKGEFKVFFPDDFDGINPNPDAIRLKKIAEQNSLACILDIAHKANIVGQPDMLRYRNHGSMRTQFWAGIPSENTENAFRLVAKDHPDRLVEFFETMMTRICIFDNRIWQRVRKDIEDGKDASGDTSKRVNFYRHKLKLVVYGESPTDTHGGKDWLQEWEAELKDFIPSCHFLVLHLSLIERILESKYLGDDDYKQGNIGLFIQKELLPAIQQGGRMRENFFLVITTGRGRSEWLASLDDEKYKDYNRFTIFRPVESIISAVEHSLSIKDDIDLKFRLAKVLFGS